MRTNRPLLLAAVLLAGSLAGCPPPPVEVLTVDPVRALEDARITLIQGADDEDPVTRANALEAMAYALGEEAGELYLKGLQDSQPMVQFAAVMAIGDLQYAPAKERLKAFMADPGSPKSVRCGVIYALDRLGDRTYAKELGPMVYESEPEVRANTALVAGKIGDKDAIHVLKELVRDEQEVLVRINARESLAMLGDRQSIEVLEAYTKEPFLDNKLVGIRALSRFSTDRARRTLVAALHREDNLPQVRVAAAGGLGRMGTVEETAYELCLRAARHPVEVLSESREGGEVLSVEVSSLQQLAAVSLGWMRRNTAVNVLYPLLRSEFGPVRVAAAASIVQLLPELRNAPDQSTPVRIGPHEPAE